MMPPDIAAELNEPELTTRHRKWLEMGRRRIESAEKYWSQRHPRWRECERILRAFRIPDAQDNQTKQDSRTEGVEKIVVPYGYAVLEAALAFCLEALTGRKPMIPVEGMGPADVLPAMLNEAILGAQCARMQPAYSLILRQWFLDAFRYGIGIVKGLWDAEEWPTIDRKASVIMDPFTGKPMSYQDDLTQRDVVRYEGNLLCNVAPFDFYPDPRRGYGDFQRGEFCGHRFMKSWTEARQKEAQGVYMGVDFVAKTRSDAGFGDARFGYGTQSNSELARIMEMTALDTGPTDDEDGKPPLDVYELWTYVDDPSAVGLERELGNSKTPRMVVLTIANLSRVVRLEPAMLPALMFPFNVFEPNYDVHAPANHSLIEVFRGLQYYYSWLYNSRMTAVRRTLNNELVYDPDMVEERDILDPEPGRLIRVKREHRGEGRAKEAVWPIPVQDTTQGHLNDAAVVKSLIQEVMGVPNLLMGMGNTGRRPATETQAVMKSATGRLGLILQTWAAQGGQPLAYQMTKNTQAFLDLTQPFALKEPYARAIGMPFIQLRPDLLQGEFTYPFLDQGLPTDQQAEAAWLKEFLIAGMQANPQLLAAFPWPAIIARFLWRSGFKDLQTWGLSPSNMSMMAPEQIQQQLQQGNLVPTGQDPTGPQVRTSQNGEGGGFPIPAYESVPNVGANGMGTV